MMHYAQLVLVVACTL